MKVIFLDIDGVLNNLNWFKSEKYREFEIGDSRANFDPTAIELLNKLIQKTDAHIVISSAWRTLYSIKDLEALFIQVGFKGKIIGKTDALQDPSSNNPAPRGYEILQWVKNYQSKRKKPLQYVILDDYNDFLESQKRHTFITDPKIGLTSWLTDQMINFLNNITNDT
ncbi:hypothetical protein UJ101_01077 [Flavobacteriaceae bacterium UJ101]|nr:hypothetical protein UJ101_01077 [Flavobacteriaceae bacterium UJ101]